MSMTLSDEELTRISMSIKALISCLTAASMETKSKDEHLKSKVNKVIEEYEELLGKIEDHLNASKTQDEG